jgi:hypothetical protein
MLVQFNPAVDRELAPYGLTARAVWAAEHTYTIYNRPEVLETFWRRCPGTIAFHLTS